MKESIDFIKKNVEDNETVVVAVSGGPDSMALLSLLIDLRDKKKFNIVTAHINHNLREESAEEFEFVKNFCEKNNCIFEGTIFEKYETNSIENEAREKRYNFFEEILSKYDSKYLFTAHHGDDLIETILMRITRGSSLEGYMGFKKISKRDNYVILRPLIFYTKDEILDYLKAKEIDYRIDKTNFSKEYTRNRYRLDVLPLLKKENLNVHKKYLKFSEEIEECGSFLGNYINEKYNLIVNNEIIDISLLKQEDIFIIKKIIYKYLKDFYKKSISLIESEHINNIIEIVNSNKPNLKLSLPNYVIIVKSYNELYIDKSTISNAYKVKIEKETDFFLGKILMLEDTDLTNNYVCHLNSNEIKLPLYVRNRLEGDYIEVLNLNGKKKIKDIFIDSKIRKEDRDDYPLVVDSDNKVVWIPGLKKSKYDRLKDGNYDIILWYTRRK